MRTKRNDNRLEQITHLVIARMPSEKLGATKLVKIMWLADLMAWRARAESLTGIEHYRRLPFGPVPTQVRAVLNGLVAQKLILEHRVEYYAGTKKELLSLQDPDLTCLSAEDVDILHRAMDLISPMTAKEASDASHDVYWEEVPENGLMSVGSASIVSTDIDQDDLNWARSELEDLGTN